MRKVEVTIKLTITVDDNSTPIQEESLQERIIADIFEPVDTRSSFQADDDNDYDFTYNDFEVVSVK